jgi:hypothetical protein
MCTTSFDIKAHIVHTFLLCLFRVMLTKVAIISLHSFNRLVFIMEAPCVFCQVRTLCEMWVNFSLRGGRAMARTGSVVGREQWTGLCASSSTLQSVSLDEWLRHIFILTFTRTRRTGGRSLTQNNALTDVGGALDRKVRSLCWSIRSENWNCLSTKLWELQPK